MLRIARLPVLGGILDENVPLTSMSAKDVEIMQGCTIEDPLSDACKKGAAILAISEGTGVDSETVGRAYDCASTGNIEACAQSAAVTAATAGCVAGVSAVGLPVAAPLCGTIAGEVVNFLWDPTKSIIDAGGRGLQAAVMALIPPALQAKGKAEYTGRGDVVAGRLAQLYQLSIDRLKAAAEQENVKRKFDLSTFDAEAYLLARMPEDWFKAWSLSMPHSDMLGLAPSWVPTGGAKGNGWWNAPILEGIVSRDMWLGIPEGAPFKVETPYWRYNYGWGGWPGDEPAPHTAFVDALSKLYTEKRVKPLQQALSRAMLDLTGQVALTVMSTGTSAVLKPSVAQAKLTSVLAQRITAAPAPSKTVAPKVSVPKVTVRTPPKAPTLVVPAWAWVAGGVSVALMGAAAWMLTREK